MNYKYLAAVIFGLISSFLTVGLKIICYNQEYLGYLPGLIFSVSAIAFWLIFYRQFHLLKSIAWIFVSCVAFFVAVMTTQYIYFFNIHLLSQLNFDRENFLTNPQSYPAFFIGGFLGALILSFGIKFLIAKISKNDVLILSLWGGVLGLAGVIPFSGNLADYGFLYLFFIWQTVMMLLITTKIDSYFIHNQK